MAPLWREGSRGRGFKGSRGQGVKGLEVKDKTQNQRLEVRDQESEVGYQRPSTGIQY